MSSPPLLRLVKSAVSKSAKTSRAPPTYNLQISCHVKPNASSQREGITSIGASAVEVCVAAAPRDGEANKAVREVIAAVFKAPKSDVEVIRGLKSRDKVVCVSGFDAGSGDGGEELCLRRARQLLDDAVIKK